MKNIIIVLILLIVNPLIIFGQDFHKLLDGETFRVETIVNEFQDGKGGLLVRVDRPVDKGFILGVIETERNLGYFAFKDRVYFLKGPKKSNGNYELWVCNGRQGQFEKVTDVTATYHITSDSLFIIYYDDFHLYPVPNIIVKSINGVVVKRIKGDDLLTIAKTKYSFNESSFKIAIVEDNENRRILFAYGAGFSGEIDLLTMKVRIFDKHEHDNILDEYFPYAGM